MVLPFVVYILIVLSQQPLFFAYEEYSATYDDMIDGIKDEYKLHNDWKVWESGYEMLANTVQSVDSKAAFHGKKAVTLSDLLIKVFPSVYHFAPRTNIP